MEKAERLLPAIVGGFFMPVFEFLYGAGQMVIIAMTTLAFFIALDWLAGVRAAHKDDTYASHYGINGGFRTFFMLLLPAGGNLLDRLITLSAQSYGLDIQFPSIFFGLFVGGLLYHTIKSMTANSIRAGWGDWLPTWILDKLTDWVRSEIESKLDRALKRKAEREQSHETS